MLSVLSASQPNTIMSLGRSPCTSETLNPFLLMDAKEFLEKAKGTSVDIVRNHQNLNPRLRRRILKDGVFIF